MKKNLFSCTLGFQTYADHDPDPANHDKPIDGANDGASGVGVLLEIARQLAIKTPI